MKHRILSLISPLSNRFTGNMISLVLVKGGDEDQIFTSGDIIVGQVRIKPSRSIYISQICILVKCLVDTEINDGWTKISSRTCVYKDRHLIFSSPDKPLHINKKNAPVLGSWPFQVCVPWRVNTQASDFEKLAAFSSEVGGPLPASIYQKTPERPGSAQSIAYYVEAVVQETKNKHGILVRDLYAEESFQFKPSRFIASPEPKFTDSYSAFSRTSSLIDDTRSNNPHLLAIRRLKPSSRQTASFRLIARVATQVCIGKVIPIILNLESDPLRSTTAKVPVVFIQRAHASLESITVYRAKGESEKSPEIQDQHIDKRVIVNSYKVSSRLIGSMSLHESVPNLITPKDIVPSFKCSTISRWYMLKVSLDLLCLDKAYRKFEIVNQVVDVCSDIHREPANTSNTISDHTGMFKGGTRDLQRTIRVLLDERLPAYREAVKE